MRSGKEGGLEDEGRRPGVVGGEGVGEALGGVAEDGTSVVADDDEAPARGLTTAGVAAGQVGGKWPRGRMLRQHPESPGRQRVQGVPLRTQEHLLHLAEPLHRQQRVLGAEERLATRERKFASVRSIIAVAVEKKKKKKKKKIGTNRQQLNKEPQK